MRAIPTLAGVLALMAVPLTASARQSTTGEYTTYAISGDTTVADDGSAQVLTHYRQFSMANDDAYPLDDTLSDCVGLIRIAADGAPASASGSCFSQDAEGNGLSFWWRMTAAMTPDCPMLCGVWTMYDGYGRLAGFTAEGTWRQEAVFPDGSSIGTWTGSASAR